MLHDTLVEGTADGDAPQPGQSLAGQRVPGRAYADLHRVAHGPRGLGEHAGQVESVADAQGGADLVRVLGAELVAGPAGDAVQLGAHIEQAAVRGREPAAGNVGAEARHAVGELRDGQGVEQLHVPQPAAAALEIGFGPVRDLPAALPSGLGQCDELVEPAADAGAPLPPHTPDQQVAQFGVAGDVAGFEHAERGGQVGCRYLQSLRDGPDAVVELDVGVPQGVPEPVGDAGHDRWVHVVVEQDEVEIGVGQHLATAEAADGDDGEAAVGCDAEFGALGDEPELVEVDEGVAQGRGVESAVAGTTGEQLGSGSGEVGGGGAGSGRSRRHRRPRSRCGGSGTRAASSGPVGVRVHRHLVHRCAPGPRSRPG